MDPPTQCKRIIVSTDEYDVNQPGDNMRICTTITCQSMTNPQFSQVIRRNTETGEKTTTTSWTSEITPFNTQEVHGATDPWGPVRSSQEGSSASATGTEAGSESGGEDRPDPRIRVQVRVRPGESNREAKERRRAVRRRIVAASLADMDFQREREALVMRVREGGPQPGTSWRPEETTSSARTRPMQDGRQPAASTSTATCPPASTSDRRLCGDEGGERPYVIIGAHQVRMPPPDKS